MNPFFIAKNAALSVWFMDVFAKIFFLSFCLFLILASEWKRTLSSVAYITVKAVKYNHFCFTDCLRIMLNFF